MLIDCNSFLFKSGMRLIDNRWIEIKRINDNSIRIRILIVFGAASKTSEQEHLYKPNQESI